MLDTMVGAWVHERERAREWRGEPVAFVQPKFDGHRLTLFGQDDGDTYMFGKLLEADLEKSHELDWLLGHIKLPRRSSIDGELHVPGKPASYVKTAVINRDPALTFTPFAVPYWEGVLNGSFQRAEIACTSVGLRLVTTTTYQGEPPATLLTVARAQRLEGWVLKERQDRGWYKLKVTRTADLVCVGIVPGKGKYAGMVGSLRGAVGNNEVACVGGMDDATRAAIDRSPAGRVFEVEYDRMDSKGRLRFPRFLRWRDDKRPEECTADQFLE